MDEERNSLIQEKRELTIKLDSEDNYSNPEDMARDKARISMIDMRVRELTMKSIGSTKETVQRIEEKNDEVLSNLKEEKEEESHEPNFEEIKKIHQNMSIKDELKEERRLYKEAIERNKYLREVEIPKTIEAKMRHRKRIDELTCQKNGSMKVYDYEIKYDSSNEECYYFLKDGQTIRNKDIWELKNQITELIKK